MPACPPRERASRPSRDRHSVYSPRADRGAAVELKSVLVHATEEAAGPSDRPTLDDFGGRSDALGG
jgi:hypothetical protein